MQRRNDRYRHSKGVCAKTRNNIRKTTKTKLVSSQAITNTKRKLLPEFETVTNSVFANIFRELSLFKHSEDISALFRRTLVCGSFTHKNSNSLHLPEHAWIWLYSVLQRLDNSCIRFHVWRDQQGEGLFVEVPHWREQTLQTTDDKYLRATPSSTTWPMHRYAVWATLSVFTSCYG